MPALEHILYSDKLADKTGVCYNKYMSYIMDKIIELRGRNEK